jgi:hypothetical protein
MSSWRLDLLPDLISAVLADFKLYWKYYVVAFASIASGIVLLMRRKQVNVSPLSLMIQFSALALLAHMTSLFLAYLGTGFVDWEIKRAASLQRYGTQVGFATCAFGLTALGSRCLVWIQQKNFQMKAGRAAMAAAPIYALALLLVLVPMLRGGKYFLEGRAESRPLAVTALKTLPPGTRVAIVGEEWSSNFAQFAAWIDIPAAQRPIVAAYQTNQIHSDLPHTRSVIAKWMDDQTIDNILMLNSLDLALDLGLPAEPDQLWSRKTGTWQVLRLNRMDRHKLPPF